LSRKVVQNCAKIVEKINFSKSPEIAAEAARRNLAQKLFCLLLKTTNKQQQEQKQEEIVMLQSVEKCVNKMYLYKQKKKKKAMEVLVLSLL
jgi:hypothetical protein